MINELERKTNEYNLLLHMDSSAQGKLLTGREGSKRLQGDIWEEQGHRKFAMSP